MADTRDGTDPQTTETTETNEPNESGDADHRITDGALIDDLHRLAAEFGDPPSIDTYREHGRHSVSTYYDRFGSWTAALELADLEATDPQSPIPEAELIAEIERVADDIGHAPSAEEMNRLGEYWVSTYRRRFGSWNEALTRAGFESRGNASPIPDDALLTALRELAAECDGSPRIADMEDDGRYSASTYVRRFGSWSAALDVAGLEAREAPSKVTDDELISELWRLAETIGRRPTATEMDDQGAYASSTYQRRFGSWSNAKEAAFGESVDDEVGKSADGHG